MMRLPSFRYEAPTTPESVVELLAQAGPAAKVLAGGTDLLPNMKRRHQQPELLVSLHQVEDLKQREVFLEGCSLGAGTTLTELAGDEGLNAGHRALRQAAAQVATPHLRNAATIGGNVCLDTRCTYYDQNEEWRQSIDYCMKAEGTRCWVAPSSPKCLAISSTDCAPALIALDGLVELMGPDETRRVPLADLYKNDGIFYMKRKPEELVTRVILPDRTGWESTYLKLRRRGSIDFPVLGVAAAIQRDGDGPVTDARLVLGAVASRPINIDASPLVGTKLEDEAIESLAAHAAKLAKPMDNSDFTLHWRKSVVAVQVAGALRVLRGDATGELPLLPRRCAEAAAATCA